MHPVPRRDKPPFQDGVRDTGGKVTLTIYDCDNPVIAAINGAAVGIGATMTPAMDLRLASTAARVDFVFGKLGIVPEAAKIVGMPTALELMYSADILSADAALSHRLVRSIHEPDDLLPSAYALAHKFTDGRSSAALAMTRRLLYAGAGPRIRSKLTAATASPCGMPQ